MKKILFLFATISLFSCDEGGNKNSKSNSLYKDNSTSCDSCPLQKKFMKSRKFWKHSTVGDSKTLPSSIKDWITSYVFTNGLSYPTYYIIKTDDLITYLNTNNPQFLHFYFCQNANTKSLDLAFLGTNKYTIDATCNYQHIPSDYVFGNLTSSDLSGVVSYDPLIDKQKYNYPAIKLPLLTSTITNSIAKSWITTYQNQHYGDNIFSFVINSSRLYDFLTNSNSQLPTIGTVPYLQIYLAYVNGVPTNPTIVMVGLNNDGTHIYYTDDGNTNYVFEAAEPCPYCGVKHDDNIDGPIDQISNDK